MWTIIKWEIDRIICTKILTIMNVQKCTFNFFIINIKTMSSTELYKYVSELSVQTASMSLIDYLIYSHNMN